jgi:glutamate synthase domain-containing protein 2
MGWGLDSDKGGVRRIFLWGAFGLILLLGALSWMSLYFAYLFIPLGILLFLGFQDYFQKSQAIRRNFPLIGRVRYLFELIRPEINQYFVESNSDGVPFSREERSVVYQRAKKEIDTLPFGTQKNVYAEGYEWVGHSLKPSHLKDSDLRVLIGGADCQKPYSASLLNISAMSFGSLSTNAVMALNGGAKDGGFAHNTGEGGLSPYHLKNGGDLIWQIGTGYFGCRNHDGTFSLEKFAKNAQREQVKMIEIKLSQGAKPSHGGILPARKVTREISEIRGVPMGQDVVSPAAHSAFSTPVELLEFVKKLREASGGKPVGFKLSIGKKREFIAICKAMIKTGITPDYISVDGGEGGTGAAPLEFSNHVGMPGVDALIFVQNALTGYDLRRKVKVFSSGRISSGFGVLKLLALGADVVYSARAMLMSLGCIQALKCNTNHCPTGVATQDPQLVAGLVVTDKRKRVRNFHAETLSSLKHMCEAMGLSHISELSPWHIVRRESHCESRNYSEMYEFVSPGDFLKGKIPKSFERAISGASPESFEPLEKEFLKIA